MMPLGLATVGKPYVWRSHPQLDHVYDAPWVVEYWVKRTICEQFFHTWHEAYQFAFAQATA